MISPRVKAYHEAGHALLYILAGIDINFASIAARPGRPGEVRPKIRSILQRILFSAMKRDMEGFFIDAIEIALAGKASERVFCPKDELSASCSRTDYKLARIAARALSFLDSGRFGYPEETVAVMESELSLSTLRKEKNSKIIRRIARALIKKRTLSGKEIAAICREER